MSRTTVTVTASNGAKVRTARGKKWYVVIPVGDSRAKVITRTNSSLAAFRAMNRWQNARVWGVVKGTDDVATISGQGLSFVAQQEKREIKAAKQYGYKHEAF